MRKRGAVPAPRTINYTSAVSVTEEGDKDLRLEELAEELYDSLRGLARSALARTPVGLDPTDLVHQAWVRLSKRYQDMPRIEFLALCATIMRRLAVDEARRLARGPAGSERVTLSGLASQVAGPNIGVLQLDEALQALRGTDERWARIVELRFFGGLSGDEVAEAMGLSRRTVVREWALARAWLKRELG